MEKEFILCAAIHVNDGVKHDFQPKNIETGYVVCGYRHGNCYNIIESLIADSPEKKVGLEKFFCDMYANSSHYKDKTFVSKKLESIKKVIDGFEYDTLDGQAYYVINEYSQSITELKVVKRLRKKLYFDDGTDSTQPHRRILYRIDMEHQEVADELRVYFDQLSELHPYTDKLLQKIAGLKCLLPMVKLSSNLK